MLEYMTNVYYNTCIHEYMYTDKLHIGIQEYKITRLHEYMYCDMLEYKYTHMHLEGI